MWNVYIVPDDSRQHAAFLRGRKGGPQPWRRGSSGGPRRGGRGGGGVLVRVRRGVRAAVAVRVAGGRHAARHAGGAATLPTAR